LLSGEVYNILFTTPVSPITALTLDTSKTLRGSVSTSTPGW